jgi:hypothetical protein
MGNSKQNEQRYPKIFISDSPKLKNKDNNTPDDRGKKGEI